MTGRSDLRTRVHGANPVPDPERVDPTELEWVFEAIETQWMETRRLSVSPPPRRGRVGSLVFAAAVVALLIAIGIPLWLLRGTETSDVGEQMTTTSPPPTSTTVVSTTTTSAPAPTTTPPPAPPTTSVPPPATTTTVPATPARLQISWQQVAAQSAFGDDDFVWSVIEAGPGLVAVGGAADTFGYTDAAVWVSTNGADWLRIDGHGVFGGVVNDLGTDRNQVMTDVARGPGGLVAVGGADASTGDTAPPVWLSADGTTWSRLGDQADVFPSGTWITAVTAGGPGYVAGGSINDRAAIWVSGDGRSWTAVDQDLAAGHQWSSIEDVIATGSGIIAVGTADAEGWYFGVGQAIAWNSVDGLAWNRQDIGSDPAALWSLVPTGGGAMAIGYTADMSAVWTTAADAATWSASQPIVVRDTRDNELWFWGGAADGDRLVVVGVWYLEYPFGEYPFAGQHAAVAWTSDDGGVTWYESSRIEESAEGVFSSTVEGRPAGFRDVIVLDGTLIAVGGTGDGSAPVWIGTWDGP